MKEYIIGKVISVSGDAITILLNDYKDDEEVYLWCAQTICLYL